MFFQPKRQNVPYSFPPVSFLKLQDYVQSLLSAYGGIFWPLDDPASNPYARVINTAVAKGRDLVVAGDMSDASKWAGTGWTVSGGVATAVNGTNFTQNTTYMIAGRAYEITYTVVSVSSGTVTAILGSSGVGGIARSTPGTYTQTMICIGTPQFILVGLGTFNGVVDNLSVKELNIPASNAVPVQLLNTDVWNGLGVGAWTAQNASVLSMQTTTRHDGISGTVFRVARALGSSLPYAIQIISGLIGKPIRVFGWARGDGAGAFPTFQDGAGTNRFVGINSVVWQPFDVIYVPTSNELRFFGQTTGTNQYVEFDVTVVTLDTGIRTDSPGVDLNMEASGTASWGSGGNHAVLSKQTGTRTGGSGTQVLRVTQGDLTGFVFSAQVCVVIGKNYRITGWVRSDGTLVPRVAYNSGTLFNGTNSASWQFFDVIGVANSNNIIFGGTLGSLGSFYVEYDDITITEISPLVGLPVNGVISGNVETNRLLNSYSFDAVNDLVNLFSGQLNSIFPTDEGTLIAFAKVNVSGNWTDGLTKDIALLESDANNFVLLQKTTVNNQLAGWYAANSVRKSVLDTSLAGSLNWFCIAVSWSKSADQVKFYINGVQVGSTQTGLGTWVGNLLSIANVLGAGTSTGTNLWAGKESPIVLLDTPLSASEVAEIAKLGDTF